jgi:hypothetical protein
MLQPSRRKITTAILGEYSDLPGFCFASAIDLRRSEFRAGALVPWPSFPIPAALKLPHDWFGWLASTASEVMPRCL